MLRYLFRGLTSDNDRSRALFDSLVSEARQPHWYVSGGVPDSVDGRFSMLATIIALASVRLEQGEGPAHAASVGLTERFVEAMDAEHRQMGLSDPGLGKHVRKLVTSLGRRVALWRETVRKESDWAEATETSVYRVQPSALEIAHSAKALRAFWTRLEERTDEALADGRIA